MSIVRPYNSHYAVSGDFKSLLFLTHCLICFRLSPTLAVTEFKAFNFDRQANILPLDHNHRSRRTT